MTGGKKPATSVTPIVSSAGANAEGTRATESATPIASPVDADTGGKTPTKSATPIASPVDVDRGGKTPLVSRAVIVSIAVALAGGVEAEPSASETVSWTSIVSGDGGSAAGVAPGGNATATATPITPASAPRRRSVDGLVLTTIQSYSLSLSL
jgi:hypothetical protein